LKNKFDQNQSQVEYLEHLQLQSGHNQGDFWKMFYFGQLLGFDKFTMFGKLARLS